MWYYSRGKPVTIHEIIEKREKEKRGTRSHIYSKCVGNILVTTELRGAIIFSKLRGRAIRG